MSALLQRSIIGRSEEDAPRQPAAASSWIERIRINQVTQVRRDGREFMLKTRLLSSGPLVRIANVFFRLARNPVRVLGVPGEWQRWEMACFEMLNGERYAAWPEGPLAVCAEKMPGTSLARHLDAGTFTEEMLEAAGIELRRAHGLHSAEFQGPWSHGDANLANFLYDPTDNRARLVDFEVMHHPSITADERHAEDLLVFLQDLAGCVPEAGWLPGALRFLSGYDRPQVLPFLAARLVVPTGVPWLWWKIRCNYLPASELRVRINALRKALPSVGNHARMDIRIPRR